MQRSPQTFGRSPLVALAAVSVLALVVLGGVLAWLGESGMKSADKPPLLVYCAVSIQPALRTIADHYEQETGTPIDLQTGPSGALETQIRLSKKGDLFLPAAETPYMDRCRADGTVREVLRLAAFRLVLAVNAELNRGDITLDDLRNGQLRYALANEEAAAGLVTRQVLEPLGDWPEIKQGAKAVLPTVTGVAQAIQQGVNVDCGFVWDATARQFSLTIVDLPEFAAGRAVVAVGVLSCSQDAAAAKRFADFLAAPDKGLAVFKKLGYEMIDGSAP